MNGAAERRLWEVPVSVRPAGSPTPHPYPQTRSNMKRIATIIILAGVMFVSGCGAMNGQAYVDNGNTTTTLAPAKDQAKQQKIIEGGIEDWERLGDINAPEEQDTMARWICNAIQTLDGPHATAQIVEFEQDHC